MTIIERRSAISLMISIDVASPLASSSAISIMLVASTVRRTASERSMLIENW